jgi:hypothetical protein
MKIAQLPEVAPERRTGLWLAWYRGRVVSTHADHAVLTDLMAAEGLADSVWYTHQDDEALEGALPPAAD